MLREDGSGTRSEFIRGLESLGLDADQLEIQLELPTNEAVRAAVEAGIGAAAISASVAAAGIEAGTLHLIRTALPERAFHAVRHAERYRTAAATALLRLVGVE